MGEIGSKLIDGMMVNLDTKSIEKLELMLKNVTEKEEMVKLDLDEIMNQMLQE